MSAAVAVVLLSMMSLLSAWAGVALAIRVGDSDRAIAGGIGFSVGIMLLISLLELIPQASVAIGVRPTMTSFALGAGLVWTAHALVPHIHHVEERGVADKVLVRSAYLIILGLILHDVPEGFAMANAYLASPSLGVLVSVAFAAGAMTFVSLYELLPMARRHGHTLLFGFGVVSSALVYWALAALMPGAGF